MKVPTIQPLGGLATKTPPSHLPREKSPDCLNVLPVDKKVRKRGGFRPLYRERMLGDAVKNVAWRARSRGSPGNTTERDFIVSPGHMTAGHRGCYDNEPALTIAMWFRPDNLSAEQAGNGTSDVTARWQQNPVYTIRVLPIISKGPVKKSDTASGVSVANQWGTATNSGMPFCVYLFNTGTASVPVWVWRISAHVKVAGAWTLQTATVSDPAVAGGRYHIIASVSNARVAIRVGRVRDGVAMAYSEAETTFTGQLASNKCPIQAFDCPQLFVEQTAVGSATQRPGLGYSGANDGGYWFASLRPEGAVDDIAIWLGDRTLSTLDSLEKAQWTGQTDLLNLWSMGGTALDYVREETGRGNHLFFVPRGPVSCNEDDGGKEGGTWFFNGETSWALMNTNGPNWRVIDEQFVEQDTGTSTATGATSLTDGTKAWAVNLYQTAGTSYYVVESDSPTGTTRGLITSNTATVLTVESWTNGTPTVGASYAIYLVSWRPAPMYALVRDNMAHGLAVEFWPDSREPAYEQVIAEIHGVMRLAINTDGKLVGYVRNGGVSARATTATGIGENYQSTTPSLTVVEPGRRYNVSLMRRDGGTTVDLYVNGFLEVTTIGLNPSNYAAASSTGNSHVPGGMTIGVGSFQRLIRGITPFDDAMSASNQVANDVTSHFVGRVETVRILCGPDAATLAAKHGPETLDQWRHIETPTWKNPSSGNRQSITPADPYDPVRANGRGVVAQVATQQIADQPVGFAVKTAFGVTGYTIGTPPGMEAQTLQTDLPDVLGHNQLENLGIRYYFVFAYWRLDVDDLDIDYSGHHVQGFERRIDSASGSSGPLVSNAVRHPKRSTHLQVSQVTDQAGMLGVIYRCCAEPDQLDDGETAVWAANGYSNRRQRPFRVRSPREIGCQWTQGMATPRLGTTPVTLLADYDVQTQQRRLSVTACGRSIYWARKPWDDGGLLFTGGTRDHVRCVLDPAQDFSLTGTTPKNTIQFTCWVKPLRLDGFRILAAKRDPGGPSLINWMVYTDNGALTIAGVEYTSPLVNSYWRFVEGRGDGALLDVSRCSSLKVGVWNHIAVVMGPTTVQAWVNGQQLALVDTSTIGFGINLSDPWGSNPSLPVTGVFYIGGSPDGFARYELPFDLTAAPLLQFDSESWYGYIQDVQVRTSADTTRYNGVVAVPPPMGTADAGSLYRWPLDEGAGYVAFNSVVATTGWNAEIRVTEFVPIASGIRQGERVYQHVGFRDRLLITNGADNPLQLSFLGFEKRSPWTIERIGIAAPVPSDGEITATTTGSAGIPSGAYLVSCSFVRDDGLESEAVQIGAYFLETAVETLSLYLRNVPRSPDPQVTKRWIYASGTGGGEPIFNREILDNSTTDIDVQITVAATGETVPGGNNFPAPRARHIGVAGSSLVLADLPDADAGQNAFAFSRSDEITQFALTGLAALIDSEDGRPIIGIGHNLGTVFFSKRDSIHALSVGAIVSAFEVDLQVRLVQASDGIGAGKASASNLLYGAGDRGVFLFNNTEVKYLSDDIEPTWRALDLTTNGLVAAQGAFWRRHTQYWISVRGRDQEANSTILVFDLRSEGWWPLLTPEHRVMRILELPDGEQVVAIGTTDGMVRYLDEDSIIEQADAEATATGSCTLQGSAGLSGSSTSLTMSGARFQTIGAGLVGAMVAITHDGITESRRITSNDGTTLRWSDALTGWTAHTSFLIGALSAYWTSPWMHEGALGQDQKLVDLALEFEPIDGDLQVDISAITRQNKPEAAWPTAADRIETFSVSMATGFAERPPLVRRQAHGNYHRIRFGTYGIQDPFGILGYQPAIDALVADQKSGRLS